MLENANEKETTLQILTLHRRFDRFARLIGNTSVDRLKASHVMVIGVGGVGSWVSESLTRSAVGRLTMIDFDLVCVTNTNRQLPAQANTVGKRKVAVMAERLSKINPQAKIEAVEEFYNADTSEELLSPRPDLIVDCIDNITAKCHLIATSRMKKIPLITSGGAGSRHNPLALQFADLMETHTDPFLQQVRKELRRHHGFPEGAAGIPCVFSTEMPSVPRTLEYDNDTGFQCVCPQGQNDYHSCERRNVIHGTASYVTGAFGLALASKAVEILTSGTNYGTNYGTN